MPENEPLQIIGPFSNHLGGLMIMQSDNVCYWCLGDWEQIIESDWHPISNQLYEALQFEHATDAQMKATVNDYLEKITAIVEQLRSDQDTDSD